MTGTSDLHQLSGAYALGALDEFERARFEHHLGTCEPCRVEVDSFLATTAELAMLEEADPGPAFRAAVLARVDETRQEGPVVRSMGRHLPRLLQVAAGLLVVAVVGLTALNASLTDRVDELESIAGPVAEVLGDAEQVRVLEGTTADGGLVRVLAAPAEGQAFVLGDGLAPLTPEQTYQLWWIVDDGARPAGLLPTDGEGGGTALVAGDLGAASALAVSVEPAGGSDAPTTEPVAVLAL